MAYTFKKLTVVSALVSLLIPAFVFAEDHGAPPAPEQMNGHSIHVKNDHLVGRGEVVSAGTSSVTVKDRKTTDQYVLNLVESSKLRFRGGEAVLADFHAGDMVMVHAVKNASGGWDVKKLLNESLRRAVLHGTVANLSGMSFDVVNEKQGTFHVTVSDSTKYRFDDEDESPASLADVVNGVMVNVKGRLHVPDKTMDQVKFVVIHKAS